MLMLTWHAGGECFIFIRQWSIFILIFMIELLALQQLTNPINPEKQNISIKRFLGQQQTEINWTVSRYDFINQYWQTPIILCFYSKCNDKGTEHMCFQAGVNAAADMVIFTDLSVWRTHWSPGEAVCVCVCVWLLSAWREKPNLQASAASLTTVLLSAVTN